MKPQKVFFYILKLASSREEQGHKLTDINVLPFKKPDPINPIWGWAPLTQVLVGLMKLLIEGSSREYQ